MGPTHFQLQVVVPTVRGREAWLDECLKSITPQIQGSSVQVKVSGNGTVALSEKIAGRHGAKFVHRPQRLSAEAHAKILVEESAREALYLWVIGDDDMMAPGALSIVTKLLGGESKQPERIDGVIGRARYFAAPSASDLGPIVPSDEAWAAGRTRTLDGAGGATQGWAAHGAFIFRANLFTLHDLERYDGTSHGIFGAFWDGLARLEGPEVEVLAAPLVFLRSAKKEWDESRLRTLLGRRDFEGLLPHDIAKHIDKSNRSLSRLQALKFAASMRPGERAVLKKYVDSFPRLQCGARAISWTPKLVARVLLAAVQKARSSADFLYTRTVRPMRNGRLSSR